MAMDINGNYAYSRLDYAEMAKERQAVGKDQGKPAQNCVGNTDKVDQEIKKLKEKKQELEQQLRSACGDEKKIRELEKKLARAEQELSRKDNDAYRKQHSVFSRINLIL